MDVAVTDNEVPVGMDPELNKELAETWNGMKLRLKELAELSQGEEYDESLTADKVKENLNAIQTGRRKKAEKWHTLKKTLGATLDIIAKVGGMVADAASQVFAPAGQCYNALNFVISAYKDYQSIFGTLNQLFTQCVVFLGRLPNYVKGKMSRGLSKVSCDVMRLFVNICDKALSLQKSPMFKFKTIAKITFLSENEFSGFIDEMAELTEIEKLEALSGIYLNSAVAAENSTVTRGILEDDRAERTEEKKEKKDRKILLQNLDFDKGPDTWDGNAESPIPTWNATYQRISQKNTAGTGRWLLEHPTFKEWKKKDGKIPILAIVGPEASGKSYLAASIIGHLQREGAREATKSRYLTAFYFLNKSKANAKIGVLGKSIIWQFAESDASYMQSAALTCEKHGRIEPKYFLTQLLLENEKEMNHIDATFYIVINKLGDSNGYVHPGVLDFLQKIDKKSSVRVLLTTTEKTAEHLKHQRVLCSMISMKENKEDLQLYINARMDRIDVLSKRNDDHVLGIRKRIQDCLQRQMNGNFYLIDNMLDEISLLDLENDIYQVLESPLRTLSQHIEDDVRKLSLTRTSKELSEINEIVLWITFSQEKMTVEKMKAVLQFHNGAVSLRPLEERLKKFLLFEIDNEGLVDFRSEMILENIPERARSAQQLRESNKVVNKGEIDILNHFLGNVCPPALIKKLELTKLFEDKLSPPKEQLYKEDSNTAHFKLAKICLHALTSPAGDNLRVLRGYAVRQMVFHMSQVELSPIDHDLRAQIGPHLVRLFRDGSAIDNLFWANKAIPCVPPWMLENSTVICKWLKDTAIVSNISEDAKIWIRDLLEDEKDTARKLNEPSAIRMAYWCFRKTLSPDATLSAYRVVCTFLSKFRVLQITTDGDKSEESCTPPTMSEIEDWCKEKLDMSKPDSRWQSQVALVLTGTGSRPEARERCEDALKLDRNNWRASLLLANIVESREEGIKILLKLVKHYGKDSNWLKEHDEDFSNMAYSLGRLYWEDEGRGKAIDWFSVSLEHGPVRPDLVFQILRKYQSDERWVEAMDIIQNLNSKSHLQMVMTALPESPWRDDIYATIRQAVVNTKKFTVFDQVYQPAIEFAMNTKRYRVSFDLRQSYASALSVCPAPRTDEIRELLEAAAGDVPYTNTDLAGAFFLIGHRLGAIYLQNAKEAKEAGKEDEARAWLDRMSSIVPEQVKEDQMRLPLRLFAARYHLIYGSEDKARLLAHNTLRMAIELLSDDDPTNDMFAYKKILYAVIPFEDKVNASTALALMKIEAPGGSFKMSCSCQCGHIFDDPGEMWWCMDCINVVLTTKCKEAIEDKRVCRSSHKHIYIPPWNGEKMRVPKNQVPWNGEVITMKEWIGVLTKAYHLTK